VQQVQQEEGEEVSRTEPATRWEDWEDEYLEVSYHDTPTEVIAEKLERTPKAIKKRASAMGLRKDKVAA
jgi:hypothetical protein